ncbi:MAG: hypothetical protein KGZ71_06355 [Desulfobulbaceae bacterium]|nr:hypothetical protein [Desulfobulbaceae bacterium]
MKTIIKILLLIFFFSTNIIAQNDIDPPILPSGINDTIFSFDSTRIIHRMDDNFPFRQL